MVLTNEYVPFTYLIGWSNFNRYYYGVRYKAKCHPTQLWKTYFTSSKTVHTFRKLYGEPDIVSVRKTFTNKTAAQRWETGVLRKLKVIKDPRWLNQAINGHIDCTGRILSEKTKNKIRQSAFGRQTRLGATLSQETKNKISIKHKGKKASLQTKLSMSKTRIGSSWWNNGIKETMFLKGNVPNGWIKGRLKKPLR